MSYKFRNDEPVAHGVRRIVREEVASAVVNLGSSEGLGRAGAIHEVRKGVKRVRGLLKMMRPVLGDAYSAEDQAWRDLGRRLSGLRDADAMTGTFNELRASCPPRLYRSLRRRLQGNKREKLRDASDILKKVSAGLKRAEARLRLWPIELDGFDAIGPGMKRTYRRGLQALRKVQAEPNPENFHSLRKRSKEHLYQLRLVEELWDRRLQRHEKRLRRLEEMLGNRQNLAVLRATILKKTEGLGDATEIEKFLEVLDHLEADISTTALKLSARVYQERAGTWDRRVQKLWNVWASS